MLRKIGLVLLLYCGIATGQAPATALPAKAYTFEVVSIRRDMSPASAGSQQAGPTEDGYRLTDMSLVLPMLAAYVPQAGGSAYYSLNQVTGLPDWFMQERYDIDARIAVADRTEWRKPEAQKGMLQSMLQAMFVERCKMAVHREVKEVAVYSLVVAKGGVKFKETDPMVDHPGGMKLPWGGVLIPSKDGGINLYGASMGSVASFLSGFMGRTGRPIQDKTGLSGNYDIVMKRPDLGPVSSEQQGGVSAFDPESALYSVLDGLGLRLEATKGQVETLIVDHIEKPSEN